MSSIPSESLRVDLPDEWRNRVYRLFTYLKYNRRRCCILHADVASPV